MTTREEMEKLIWDYGNIVHFYGNQGDKVAAAMDAVSSALAAMTAERDAKHTALEFAQRAIEDTIFCEDGLDGDTGARVLHIIGEALTQNTFDQVKYGELPKSMWELEADRLAAAIAAEKEQHACTIDVLCQTRVERDALRELLKEIHPQVDMVRGSWFDRCDAALAAQEKP